MHEPDSRTVQRFTIFEVAADWYRSALCGHPLPTLTDNWTRGAASRHTTAPNSHTRPLSNSPRQVSYYSFLIPLRVGNWVGLSTQWVSKISTCARLLAVDQVRVEPAPCRLQWNTLPLDHCAHPNTMSLSPHRETYWPRIGTQEVDCVTFLLQSKAVNYRQCANCFSFCGTSSFRP